MDLNMGNTTLSEAVNLSLEDIRELLAVWHMSVKATHHFLSQEQIAALRPAVMDGINEVEHLVLAKEDARLIGFMGVEGAKIEMLFLAPDSMGKGIGRQFISYAAERYGAAWVDVNEDNKQACAFYEHMGFHVYGRSDTDGQGNPYPILHMKRS